jgi:hypothetical protein
MARKH